MVTNFTITAGSWYDSVDDTTQQLEFRTYFVYNKRNYMITSWSSSNSITLQIPYFIETAATKSDISLCIQAKDKFGATTTECNEYTEVLSNFDGDKDALFGSISTLDFSDHDNMLKLSLYINFALTFMSFGEKTTDYSHPASADYI